MYLVAKKARKFFRSVWWLVHVLEDCCRLKEVLVVLVIVLVETLEEVVDVAIRVRVVDAWVVVGCIVFVLVGVLVMVVVVDVEILVIEAIRVGILEAVARVARRGGYLVEAVVKGGVAIIEVMVESVGLVRV